MIKNARPRCEGSHLEVPPHEREPDYSDHPRKKTGLRLLLIQGELLVVNFDVLAFLDILGTC